MERGSAITDHARCLYVHHTTMHFSIVMNVVSINCQHRKEDTDSIFNHQYICTSALEGSVCVVRKTSSRKWVSCPRWRKRPAIYNRNMHCYRTGWGPSAANYGTTTILVGVLKPVNKPHIASDSWYPAASMLKSMSDVCLHSGIFPYSSCQASSTTS